MEFLVTGGLELKVIAMFTVTLEVKEAGAGYGDCGAESLALVTMTLGMKVEVLERVALE